ncbi:MAG: hypothetical protein HY332_25685 [Chloroflexi bacterium]|nr:hypothetical protein [Chloroflexota bacterium]
MATAERAARSDSTTVLRADALRTTRYSDVCGGTDELKRLLTEEPDLAASPQGRETLWALVDDGVYMLARMEERLREYQAFRDELERQVEQMRQIEGPRLHDAAREAGRLRALLSEDNAGGPLPAQEIVERAEEIRQVANDIEGALRRHKDAAIQAGRAYLRLRGARGWDDGSTTADAAGAADVAAAPAPAAGSDGAPEAGQGAPSSGSAAQPLPPGVPEAWLPPPPHREVIVDWLRRGRASLLSAEEAAKFPPGPQGREPLVQFEDGGVMPLRVVRWSDEVRNFYSLGTDPHPRGRLYRKRDVGPERPPET